MNNNSSKQILLSVIGVAILVIAVVGVSFAFFSYVYNGEEANTIQTGTIVFEASDTNFKLTNIFPTDTATSGIEHNDDVLTATVKVYGNTTYENGIQYTVRAVNVTNATSAATQKIYPRVIVTPTQPTGVTLDEDYAAAKTYGNGLNGNTILESGAVIGKGVIKPSTGASGVLNHETVLTIAAYYDKDDYHISDNEEDELVAAGLLDENYAGQIIKTADWNAMSAAGAYSFKIQVTAVENGSDDARYPGQVNYGE